MLNRSRGIHKLLPFSLIILIAVFSVAACGAIPADTFSVILCIGDGMGPEQIKAASYYTAGEDASDLSGTEYISGQFGLSHLPYEYDGLGDLPRLHEMTLTALDSLSEDPDGFFLLIEGGRIDHACHANDIARAVFETAEFSAAVKAVETWMGDRDDILLIVTADHETGGLSAVNRGEGVIPGASWTTTGHTEVEVPLYATGYRSDIFKSAADKTVVYDLIVSLME